MCDHLPCNQPIASLATARTETVTDDFGRRYETVLGENGALLGSIRYEKVACWATFGGGQALGDEPTRLFAVRRVIENANASSFAFRMALHG